MTDLEIERARHEAQKALGDHALECERRYGELRTRMAKLETMMGRNTALLKTVLGTQLALAAAIVAAAIQGIGA